ncbi:beta-ketoacyl-ACP synthase III [Pediococcus acidilactici]|uniref:beta-ketoacyl-ACP synthase III n=1 Tax=Pediococcus acidilactici TaxID=1254 RepID=UPI003A92289D
MKNVELLSTGKYLPKKIVTNNDLEKIVDTSDEWIQQRTGIKQRRISQTENTSDLAAKAAQQAIMRANIDVRKIDLIIVSTMTPDSNMPSTACIVQNKIGADNAFCFDVSAACSGFVYALTTAEKIIRHGNYNCALVIASEVNSKYIDWSDRASCVLFGDGAGAVVIKGNDQGREDFLNEKLESYGEYNEALSSGITEPEIELKDKEYIKSSSLKMDGQAVFNFTITKVPNSINSMMEELDEDIDVVIAHQANIRIIKLIAKRTGIDENNFFVNLQKYGNTSSASVAIALDEYISNRKNNSRENILLSAFGGGLTIGNVLIRK